MQSFNVAKSLQEKCRIKNEVCLWQENGAYKAQETKGSSLSWMDCTLGKSAMSNILPNEILHLNFPLSLPCCIRSGLALCLWVWVNAQEGAGKEGEDGCGWGVKVTADLENNFDRYSCFLTAVLSSLHSKLKLQFPWHGLARLDLRRERK